MAPIKLADSNAGSLFAISQADWTQISKRVGLTIVAAPIAPTIGQYLPEFPTLVPLCQAWASTAFPQIVTMSGQIVTFAKNAATELAAIQQTIAPLKDPLPADVAAKIRQQFACLAGNASPVNNACAALSGQVAAFVTANQVIDQEIINAAGNLGPEWQPIEGPVNNVSAAAGLVLGAWSAIATDFNNVATGTIPLSIKLLLSLDIQSAISAWTQVGSEAAAFPSLAAGQQQYLSGAWLGQGARRALGLA
jgi:hypothetical protein